VAHHNFGKRYETISIIAWVLNWGSIPLYDYSWGGGKKAIEKPIPSGKKYVEQERMMRMPTPLFKTITGASSPNCGDESGVQLSSMVYGP